MYIPHDNQMDQQEALGFMRNYSFGTIINNGVKYPLATHLPFVIKEKGGRIQLLAHFAKANEQWKLLDKTTSLVLFQEPHAYISPQHYNKKQSVPTWNYVAVHAYGKATVITDESQGFEILEELILSSEPQYLEQWKALSSGYKQAMYEGIIPFIVDVNQLEGKAKLSQNKKPEERSRIANTLSKSQYNSEKTIGDMMK